FDDLFAGEIIGEQFGSGGSGDGGHYALGCWFRRVGGGRGRLIRSGFAGGFGRLSVSIRLSSRLFSRGIRFAFFFRSSFLFIFVSHGLLDSKELRVESWRVISGCRSWLSGCEP